MSDHLCKELEIHNGSGNENETKEMPNVDETKENRPRDPVGHKLQGNRNSAEIYYAGEDDEAQGSSSATNSKFPHKNVLVQPKFIPPVSNVVIGKPSRQQLEAMNVQLPETSVQNSFDNIPKLNNQATTASEPFKQARLAKVQNSRSNIVSSPLTTSENSILNNMDPNVNRQFTNTVEDVETKRLMIETQRLEIEKTRLEIARQRLDYDKQRFEQDKERFELDKKRFQQQ